MQRILQIARREYIETVKTRTFLLMVFMAPLIVGGTVFFTSRLNKAPTGPRPLFEVDWADLSGRLADEVRACQDGYNQNHPAGQIHGQTLDLGRDPNGAVEQAKDRLRNGSRRALVILDRDVVDGPGKVSIYTYKSNASDLDRLGAMEGLVRQAVVNCRCREQGISADTLNRIRAVPVESVEIGAQTQRTQGIQDKITRMMLPFFFMYLMFMGMMGTGQQMLSSVIEEKNSRMIEVLLSAVNPFELMTGKILGLAGVGLSVVGIWGGLAFVGARYRGLEIAFEPGLLVFFVAYFLLGFLLFTALLAAAGSICNTIKESQGLMMPVTILFVIPLMAWFRLVQDPNGLLARVLSYFPPITSMVMVLRLSAGPDISIVEIAASFAVLGLSVVGALWVAAKVFRVGILMYGKRPGFAEILRWVRQP